MLVTMNARCCRVMDLCVPLAVGVKESCVPDLVLVWS